MRAQQIFKELPAQAVIEILDRANISHSTLPVVGGDCAICFYWTIVVVSRLREFNWQVEHSIEQAVIESADNWLYEGKISILLLDDNYYQILQR